MKELVLDIIRYISIVVGFLFVLWVTLFTGSRAITQGYYSVIVDMGKKVIANKEEK